MTRKQSSGYVIVVAMCISLSAKGQSILDITPPGVALVNPEALSADGSVVVGFFRQSAASQNHAFRWSLSDGFEDLGLMPEPCHNYSQATCISSDGNVIGGYGGDGNGGSDGCGGSQALAFRWTRASGMTTLPWGGVAPCGGGGAVAYAMNDDGTIMVGDSNFGCGSFACNWTFSTSGVPQINKMSMFDTVGFAWATSGDGLVTHGTLTVSSSAWHCRWINGSPAQFIPVPGYPRAASSDGLVIVGNTGSPSIEAYRFSDQGVQLLGSLASGVVPGSQSVALGVSGDGDVIVGGSTNLNGGSSAFLWTPVLGMVDLNTYLPSVGVDLSGWVLTSAKAVSADGSTILGSGLNQSGGVHQWLVRLGHSAWTDLGFGVAGISGVPRLKGTGTLIGNTSGSISLTSAKTSSQAMLFVSLASVPVPFMGGVLVSYPVTLFVALATDGAGSLKLPFLWPVGIPSATSLYFQCAIQDSAGPHGVSLSNALKAVGP